MFVTLADKRFVALTNGSLVSYMTPMAATTVQRIQNEYVRRTQLNSRYSLRAFARDLQISPSYLCEVLKGRRLPSSRILEVWQTRLGLKTPPRVQLRSSVLNSLNWVHLSLLEIISAAASRGSEFSSLAEALEISSTALEKALKELQQCGLIKQVRRKSFAVIKHPLFADGVASSRLRELHKEFLELAIQRLEFLNFDQKDFNANVVLLTSEQVRILESKIKSVLSDLPMITKFNGSIDSSPRRLYGFSTQLFELSKSISDPKSSTNKTGIQVVKRRRIIK